MTPSQRRVAGLVALLGGSGLLHFAIPRQYAKIVPPSLGDPGPWVAGSGVAELVCAALLTVPSTRRLGGYLSAGLFIGVLPANLYSVKAVGPSRWLRAGAVARLPLQIPMVTAAMKVAREA